MPETQVSLAILFADLGESAHLYDTLGDVRAHSITSQCLERLTATVERHGGTVIKTIGDEVMSTFATAGEAAEAASAIQQAMSDASRDESIRLGVHVGLHFGPVLEKAGDVFGDAVNVAARMVGLAKQGQILTTRQLVDRLAPELRAHTRQIDRRAVKGKQEQLDIFEVIWQRADLTALNPIPVREPPPAPGCLILSLRGQEFELSPARTMVTIGRDQANDLVVSDPRASRQHARVELRQGKFVLYDRSTNGTVVCAQGARPIYLRGEELMLPSSGTISVAPSPEEDSESPIHFRIQPRSREVEE